MARFIRARAFADIARLTHAGRESSADLFADTPDLAAAKAIVQVVDMPFGKRPVPRAHRPAQDDAEIVNGVADRVRAEMYRNIGLADLLTPRDLAFTVSLCVCENGWSMWPQFHLGAGAVLLASLTGCGYHTVGSAAHLPAAVHTVAVPFFENRTQLYHTEVSLTQAVIRELDTRTKLTVVSGENATEADATLKGVLLTETIVPYTYNSKTGQSSSYLITIVANVELTNRAGRVLYRHDDYKFHQQYEATSDLASFIQEDAPATERLARDFAQTFVSDMLESF